VNARDAMTPSPLTVERAVETVLTLDADTPLTAPARNAAGRARPHSPGLAQPARDPAVW